METEMERIRRAVTTTRRICVTKTLRAEFRRAPCPPWRVTFLPPRPTSTMKTARLSVMNSPIHKSGQFARYLRSETDFAAHGHIRKYDGEPFMPHHIVEAVKSQLAGTTRLSVPVHEVNA